MSERLETTIVVTDRGSQTFTKVGSSATKMGTDIDKAATTGSRGLNTLSKSGAAAGAAFASLSGVLTLAAHANAEAEASHARLETAIENTGHSLLEYQDQLDAASKKALQLGFDDEDAADSIAALTTATGNAQTSINDLAIAEDIARARNIDLASATKIVIAAEQGRVGALKRVGIEVDATMSKEEIMDALRAKFAGNAEAYSTTTAAGFDRLKNATENALESIGAHLGPAQELLMIMPGLSAGFTGVGAAVGALAPEMTAASAAAGVLNFAMGPVGLAFLAVGAGVAIYELSKHLGGDLTPAADQAKSSLQSLDDEMMHLIQINSVLAPLAKQTKDDFDYINTAAGAYADGLKALTDRQQTAALALDNYTTAEGKNGEFYQQHVDDLVLANAAVAQYISTQGRNAVSMDKLSQAVDAANHIIADTSKAAVPAQSQLKYLDSAVESGEITWSEYVDQVLALNAAMPTIALGMIGTASATNTATQAAEGGTTALTAYTAAFKAMNVQAGDLNALMGSAVPFVRNYTNELTGAGQGAKVLGDQFTDMADGAGSAGDALIAETKAQNDANAAAEAGAKAFLAAAQGIGFLDSELKQLIAADSGGTWAERTASRVIKATDGLGSMMMLIIDGTKNLSSQSQDLNDWAIGLINVAGYYGKIDDLLVHGQITLTTYNQAQEAGTRIFADNAAVQEDLLRIQAKQAPLLADSADAYAKYIDQLADLPPQQELVALGWMDQNEAAKANAALALAAAAANGEYGDAGEQAASQAITAQAQADPAFKAMLTDMGVISEGANGEIVVNFPTASQVHDDTVNLTASIDALTVALGGIPPSTHTEITADYSDLAAGVAGAQEMLSTIDGRTVTTYVNIEQGYVAPGTLGYQHGGVIPHAQHGRMGDGRTVIVGESGPELVKLPGGSLAIPAPASKELLRGRGGGTIVVQNMTVVANNPRDFSDQMRGFNFGYGARS
jgi:hypothetical protein